MFLLRHVIMKVCTLNHIPFGKLYLLTNNNVMLFNRCVLNNWLKFLITV